MRQANLRPPSVRPRSFLPDWPVLGPVLGGLLRPVSNPDGELEYAFVSGRPGTKTGKEPKLASLFPVSTARNGTTPPTIRIGAGSLSPRREHATTQQRRRRGGAGRPRGGVRQRQPYVLPFLVLLAGDPLALPFVLVFSPSRVLDPGQRAR